MGEIANINLIMERSRHIRFDYGKYAGRTNKKIVNQGEVCPNI